MSSNNSYSQDYVQSIKDVLRDRVLEVDEYPYFYSVLQFGFYDNYGQRLPYEVIKNYWKKDEVQKTCNHLKKVLYNHLGILDSFFFIERHASRWEIDENNQPQEIQGRFHINVIASNIPDHKIEDPDRHMKRLLYSNNKMGIPINQMQYQDIDEIKKELFNACCLKYCSWLNRYQYSIKTELMYDPADVENATYYCLKDFKPSEGLDFDDVVVFSNQNKLTKRNEIHATTNA